MTGRRANASANQNLTIVVDHGGIVGPMTERIQASEFKARCLALLDDVARHRTEIIVTKHGKPVAKLVPVGLPTATDGSVTLLADDDDAYFGTGEAWNADV
jgi:prevent-host-death family protein